MVLHNRTVREEGECSRKETEKECPEPLAQLKRARIPQEQLKLQVKTGGAHRGFARDVRSARGDLVPNDTRVPGIHKLREERGSAAVNENTNGNKTGGHAQTKNRREVPTQTIRLRSAPVCDK